jgi:hypothetical protein
MLTRSRLLVCVGTDVGLLGLAAICHNANGTTLSELREPLTPRSPMDRKQRRKSRMYTVRDNVGTVLDHVVLTLAASWASQRRLRIAMRYVDADHEQPTD